MARDGADRADRAIWLRRALDDLGGGLRALLGYEPSSPDLVAALLGSGRPAPAPVHRRAALAAPHPLFHRPRSRSPRPQHRPPRRSRARLALVE